MTGERPGGSTPDWLADYDEALRRGEAFPETDADRAGIDRDPEDLEFREMLRLLNLTLRAPDAAPHDAATLVGGSELASTPEPGGSAEDAGCLPLGRFLIERELGRGGYGIVYLARDPEMDRRVALKLPCAAAHDTPGIRRWFLREARAAARLDHPNLVPVYEAGQIGPICYIASAYCAGPNLARWLAARGGRIEPRQAARLVLAMAGGVAQIHDRGLLHCDLKPGNILIDPPDHPDGEPVPRITDFGLARLHETASTSLNTGRPMGTPPYMAPEQIDRGREAIGPPADVYALGAILYELLTGTPPHNADSSWRAMRDIVTAPPVPPRRRFRSIPRDLEAICMRCLEKRPGARYATASDLVDDLRRFLDGRPTAARPLGPVRRGARWCRRKPGAAASLGLAALTLALSLGSAVILSRVNRRLERANAQALRNLEAERRQRYVADLALAQQDSRLGRIAPAQRRLRRWIPQPGAHDYRDFAWFHLYRRTRHDRTVLSELMPGASCQLAVAGNLLLGVTTSSLGFWKITRADSKAGPVFAASRPTFRFRPGPADVRPWGNGDLSPDGRLVVVDRRDAQDQTGLTFLDARTGAVLADVPWPEKVPGCDVRFSADGGAVAVELVASPDFIPRITTRMIALADGRQVVAFGVTRAMSIAAGFDPERVFGLRRALAPQLYPWRLTAWNLHAGTRRWARGEEEVLTDALAYSPRPGGPIATATPEGTVQLRSPVDGSVISKLEGHGSLVRALAFSADGRLLAAGASNRRAILWDVSTRRRVAVLEGLGGHVRSIVFLPDSSDIALGLGSGQVVIWHTRPLGEAAIANAHGDQVWGLAYSPDGRLLASVGGDRLVKLWDARSGRLTRTLTGHEDWPSRVVFSPDGRRIASANFGGRVLVWEVESGRLQKAFAAHEAQVRTLKFSPDGRLLATGGFDHTIRLWDTATWEPAGVLSGHGDKVRDLAFLPDGTTLASAGEDMAVLLWDLPSRRVANRWPVPADINVSCIAVSPDGATIAAGDDHGALRIWDAETRQPRATLRGLHTEEISDLAFTPDGRILAVAGQDRLISLVDVATSQPLLSLSGHDGGVNQVEFSPDGGMLASSSHDRSIRFWQGGPTTSAPMIDPDLE
jgi:WD40 repeat protein/serine/threonine protein kinase